MFENEVFWNLQAEAVEIKRCERNEAQNETSGGVHRTRPVIVMTCSRILSLNFTIRLRQVLIIGLYEFLTQKNIMGKAETKNWNNNTLD